MASLARKMMRQMNVTAVFSAIFGVGCLFLLSCGGTGVGISQKSSATRDYWGDRPGPRGFRTVILDAGHGGSDSGAVAASTGAREKDLTLNTALRVQQKLRGKAQVILMRNKDEFIDLDERVRRASQRDDTILVSIHYNSGSYSAQGPEVYWWRVDSWGLANRLQTNLLKVASRGGANRGLVRRRLRLTRNPNIPSVLVECGYLSNPVEARKINTARHRERLATAIARAILEQQQLGDPPGILPKPIHMPPSRPTDPPGS